MIIIFITIICLIALILLCSLSDYYSITNTVSWVGSIVVGIVLFLMLLAIPLNQYWGKQEVERYYALQQTIEKSREGEVSEVERAALTREISEYNKDLASVKYKNNSIFKIWVYNGLAELEYLE